MTKIIITSHKIKSGKLFIAASIDCGLIEELEIDKASFENYLTGGKESFEWSLINRQADTEIEGQCTIEEYWSDCNDIHLHLTEFVNADFVTSCLIVKEIVHNSLIDIISLLPEDIRKTMRLASESYAQSASTYATALSNSKFLNGNVVVIEQLKKSA